MDPNPQTATDDPALRAVAAKSAEGIPVIIAFSNRLYLRVLRNWVAAMRRLQIENFVIIALDEETRAECAALSVPHGIAHAGSSQFKDLMRARVKLFRDLAGRGIDFINSDLDAVWLRDPLPYLESLDGDLLVSQGTIQPPDILERWGFVACSGFFLSRASERMRRFYDLMIADDRGDQISMSQVLVSDNVKFKVTEAYTRTFRGHAITCSRKPIIGKGDQYKVTVLPHHLFQRLVEDHGEAFVIHPLSKKEEEDKLRSFREHGCLFAE